MERDLTCIVCPMGCGLKVKLSDRGELLSITGNGCPRGAKYAQAECTNPTRTITSTVRCSDGGVVPVKTDKPIPKAKIFECMDIINKTVANLPISTGDIIIENIFGSNIIATGGRKE